jgi:hypothetical protein
MRALSTWLLTALACLPLLGLPACAQTRCSGMACESSGDTQAVAPIRSQHYRVRLRAGALEARELTSAHYRLRATAGAVRLEARP